jgi:RNA polymerase sigma-70 factor (ECF subfamily)
MDDRFGASDAALIEVIPSPHPGRDGNNRRACNVKASKGPEPVHASAEGAMIATVIDAHSQPGHHGASGAPERAFADVAREQIDGLYGYCVRLTNGRTDAEDLVQDTLLRAMRAYPGLRDEQKVKSWLFTIATNAWRDLCRARGRTLTTVSLDDTDREDDFSLFATLAIEDPFPYSDELHLDFLRLFRDEDVQDVFARINPVFRAPLILTTVHGFSCKEAAAILDVPLGTLLSRVHRGRKQLERGLWDYAVKNGLVEVGDEP